MASRYIIVDNTLREYDERVITQRINNPTGEIMNFRSRILEKVVSLKNNKINKKKTNDGKKIKFKDFVYLTQEEYDNLLAGYGSQKVKEVIERLSTYIGSKGDKYKSHYHTIIMWFQKQGIKNTPTILNIEPQTTKKENIPLTEEQKKEIREKMERLHQKFRS